MKCVCETCAECPFEHFCDDETKELLGNVFVVYNPGDAKPVKIFKHRKEAIRFCNEQRCKSLFNFFTYVEMKIE